MEISVLIKQPKNYVWNRKKIDSTKMNEIIGGFIDKITLPNHIDIWVNDEGTGTEELNLFILWSKDEQQPIFGTAIFAGYDSDGTTISLSNHQYKWLANHLKLVTTQSGKHVFAIDLMEEGVIA